MTNRGKRAVAVVAGAILPSMLPASPAGAELVIAGVCHFTLATDSRPRVPIPSLTSTNIDIGGDGMCRVNVGIGTGEYSATLDTTVTSPANTLGCLTGAALGTGTFTLNKLGFPGNLSLAVVATVTGVLTVTGVDDEQARLVGSGAFAPTTGSAAACTAGATAMSWCGVFVFEDPEL